MIRILVYRRVLMAAAIVGALCGAALIKGGDAFGATGRRGFELPSAWTDLGTVAEWRAADRQIYRSSAGSSHLDRSRDHIDQEAVYAATRDYRGRLSGLPPAAWAGLDEDERQERRAAAAAELKFVIDFRYRVSGYVQDARAGLDTGWGARVSDHTVMAEMLSRLRTAVGLAPDNPYAWHLYAYFCTLVGDDLRALRALDGAQAALDLMPSGELAAMRAAVWLDRAWLLRDLGDFEASRAALEQAASLGARGVEPRLLQGLLAAQTGDDQVAIAVAAELRAQPVAAFPMDFATGEYVPETTNIDTWSRKASTYLHDWIMAYTWLRVGRVDMARAAFGTFNLDSQRLFAHRFWNEAGDIYLATGRPALAAEAWNQSFVTVPYQPYLLAKRYAHSLAPLTGRPGGGVYELSYDANLMVGSRLAWAAELVDRLADTYDEHERQRLASRALDALEICRRQGVFAGQAAVLQGQVYHLMGDSQSAYLEVEEALALLEAQGDRVATAAVLSGLSRSPDELEPRDIANFYGQSGSSRGRWAATADPEAAGAALRAAYDEEPNAANRVALARFLVRNGEADAGRRLALGQAAGEAVGAALAGLSTDEITVVLEADRARGDPTAAQAMVAALNRGEPDPWSDAGVWALAGFICLDQDRREDARVALERASVLDPGNRGLKIQLSLM